MTSYHEQAVFGDEEAPEYISQHTVHRVRPDGKVFAVFEYSVDQSNVVREFRANPDGSLLISDGKDRSQTLRWNAALYRFVP